MKLSQKFRYHFTKSIKFNTTLFGRIQATHSYRFLDLFIHPVVRIHLCGLFTHFSGFNFCPFSIFHFMLPFSPVSHSSLINHPNNTCWAQIMQFFLPKYHPPVFYFLSHPVVLFIPDSFSFCDATAQFGAGPPFCWDCWSHTIRHKNPAELLYRSDQPLIGDAAYTTHNKHKRRPSMHVLSGLQIRDTNNPTAAVLPFRPQDPRHRHPWSWTHKIHIVSHSCDRPIFQFITQWLLFILRIWYIKGSNLGPEADCPEVSHSFHQSL